jgi:hypothetical protein
MNRLGLTLHPVKTRMVDLRRGKESFVFLGCTIRKRRSIQRNRGWGNYFRTGNADREFNKMDGFVVQSLRRWQYRRGGQRPTKRPKFTWDQLYGMGLHRLMGTVRYPSQATPVRSSLSRVRENRTHGLKGEIRNGLA